MSMLEKFHLRALGLLSVLAGRLLFLMTGVRHGKRFSLSGLPIVTRCQGSTIVLGEGVTLCSVSQATALGVNHPVVLRTLAPAAEIRIGDDTGISGGSICAARSVRIGARVMLGANVTIADTDFHDFRQRERRHAGLPAVEKNRPVVIEDDAFLGANVIVLKGVTIGAGAVIGAGSVVVGNVPPHAIAAGNPCRVIREGQNPVDEC